MLIAIALILVAGTIGGIVNGLLTEGSILIPGKVAVKDNMSVWRPGILGNIFIGAVAAFVFWTVYGSGNVSDLLHPPSTLSVSPLTVGFSILTGIAGARWLTNEVDKNVLKKSLAMVMKTDSTIEQKIMEASPMQILGMAVEQEMHNN